MEKRETKFHRANKERNVWQCEKCMCLAEFEADGPFENQWDYCPYCGRKIKHVQV